jgi:hypothetical protein
MYTATQVSGFMEPTAVQAEAIDAVVCQGRDALVLPSCYFFFPSMYVGTYILVYMCPHTTVYVSSYHYVCVSHVGCADTCVMILFVIDAAGCVGAR